MRIENGNIILERKNCTRCNAGTIPSEITCPKCNGTGNGPRGGKRGCKKCSGFKTVFDHDNRLTCPDCNGDYINAVEETPYDHIYISKNDLDVKVIRDRETREMSWAEQFIGVGLFSCTDYGRHKDMSDDELIESAFHFDEKGTFWTQGIKLVRNKHDLSICNYLAIVTGNQGYSVIPIFEEAS